ncbi:MAG: hypothetical protein Q9163_005991 [Psora crenata]
MADFGTAIQRYQKVLDATPVDHPDRARRLGSLGAGYGYRYKRTGIIADLEIAIQRFQEALDITPADHPDRASRLRSLGMGYQDRYQRIGTIADLEIAIQRYQEALDITPVDHRDRARRLGSLGAGYQDRYQRTGAIADLEIAIQRFQEALDITPADHPDRARLLHSPGPGYNNRSRFEQLSAVDDLGEAICLTRKTVEVTPESVMNKIFALADEAIPEQETLGVPFAKQQDRAVFEHQCSENSYDVDRDRSLNKRGSSLTSTLVNAIGLDKEKGTRSSTLRDDNRFAREQAFRHCKSNDDIRSIVSNEEDINSQSPRRRPMEEITAEAHLGVLLAQSEKLQSLYKGALARMSRARFKDNLQQLLKDLYLDLRSHAENDLEHATASLLKSRWCRTRIAQKILDQVEPETDELRSKIERQNQETVMKLPDVENWIVGLFNKPVPEEVYQDDKQNSFDGNEGTEDESDEEIGDEHNNPDILPNVAEMEKFILDGTSFQRFSASLRKYLAPASLSTLTRVVMTIPGYQIWFSSQDDRSFLNRVKLFIEKHTEEDWDWWPLRRSMQYLQKDQTRMHWRCHCDTHLWAEISTSQARVYELLLNSRDTVFPDDHLCRPRRKRSFSNITGVIRAASSSSFLPAWFGSSGSSDNASASSTRGRNANERTGNSQDRHTELTTFRTTPSNQPNVQVNITTSLAAQWFVLFGVKGPRRTPELAQINAKKYENDNAFFKDMSKHYKSLRGYLRYWFSVWQLTYCDFVKFEKIKPNRIVLRGKEIPMNEDYEYKPRLSHPNELPISEHELEMSLSACESHCALSWYHDCYVIGDSMSAIERIPRAHWR